MKEDYKTVYIFIILLTVMAHVSNTLLVYLKRTLHQPGYYLLTHLSLCDILMLVVLTFQIMLGEHDVLEFAIDITYTASILSTLTMTVDRFTSSLISSFL